MKKVEKLAVEYVGIKDPKTDLEVEFEISGLESVICEIKARVAKLKQAKTLRCLLEANNEKTEQ